MLDFSRKGINEQHSLEMIPAMYPILFVMCDFFMATERKYSKIF